MDGPRNYHAEWSKSDREEISYDIPICGIKKRNDTNELTNQKETHRLLPVPTAMFKMGNQQGPTVYSTWNSVQCCVAAWMGGEFGAE